MEAMWVMVQRRTDLDVNNTAGGTPLRLTAQEGCGGSNPPGGAGATLEVQTSGLQADEARSDGVEDQ